MTEEQRVKLEELISEFELYVEEVVLASEEGDLRYARSQREKARDRITDHLTLIQYNNALYNFQRFGVKDLDDLDLREWEKKSPVFMDVDNKDEDGVGVDLPKCLVESPRRTISEEDMYEAGFIPVIGHLDDFPVVTPKEEKEEEK